MLPRKFSCHKYLSKPSQANLVGSLRKVLTKEVLYLTYETIKTKVMKYGGIDACKAGWVLIRNKHKTLNFGGIYKSIENLLSENTDLDRILIDMPLGLSSVGFSRTLEAALRKELGRRHATVFNTPCRESLSCQSYEQAKAVNQEVLGKRISKQTYNISGKIKEVDKILKKSNYYKELFIESHPEICFKYLNEKRIVYSKKSTSEGIAERLNILSKFYPNIPDLYEAIIADTKRKDAKRDDIIDALCLCLTNTLAEDKHLSFIKSGISKDKFDIKIQIGYYEPKTI